MQAKKQKQGYEQAWWLRDLYIKTTKCNTTVSILESKS